MRRLLLVVIVLVALAVPTAWWLSRPSPGESLFKDYAPSAVGKTWTITGSPGSKHLAFVDPTGAIQPRRGSYSVHFFVYDHDKHRLYSPLLRSVRSRTAFLSWAHGPEMTWKADGLQCFEFVFASSDTCYSEYFIRDLTRQKRHISVFAAAVPYQVIGPMQARADVSCDEDSRSIVVDGKVLVASDTKPTAVGATSGANGHDVTSYIRKGVLPVDVSARGMLANLSSGAMRFALVLKSGKGEALRFAMPMTDVVRGQMRPLTRRAFTEASERVPRAWGERLESVWLQQLPDRRVTDCFKASVVYLLMLSGDGTPKPGPSRYHSFWVRDAAYMADALYYAGQQDLIPPALAEIRAMQLSNGGFLPRTGASRDDELDAPGEAIYAMVKHYRRTGDAKSLQDAWPTILSACRYIRAKRVSSDGILPASVSAEDLGKGDQQHYWDDFWCIRGLRDAAFAATKLGKSKDAAWIKSEADSLLRATLASVAALKTPYIPNGPQDLTSSAMARGTSCALWPCAVLDPNDPLTKTSFDTYWTKWIAPSGGGFVHKGHYWPYAGLDLAQGYLMLGQRERAWKILDWTLDHDPTRGFYSWPEGMSMKDGGLAEGDMPHGWMCAAYISLVRNMLVRESGKDLVLLSGVPKQWLKPGMGIAIKGFPTEFGKVSYSADVVGNELKLEFFGAKPDGIYRVILPGNREIVIPAAARQATIPLK